MISRHIKKHRHEGMPQDQAVAAAMSEARRKGQKAPSRKKKGARTKANRPGPGKGTRKQAKAAAKRAGSKGGKARARKAKKSR